MFQFSPASQNSFPYVALLQMLRIFTVTCFVGCLLAAGFAQENSLEEHRTTLERVGGDISDANEDQLLVLREEVRGIRLAADSDVAPARARMVEVQTDLERIGPDPEDGITESPELISLRARLRSEFESLDAMVSQADLNIIEANRLLIDIANRRRDAFYERVLERDDPPFSLKSANVVMAAIKTDWQTFQARYASWKASFKEPGQLQAAILAFVLTALAILVLVWPIPRWLDRSLLTAYKQLEPTPSRRATLAALRVVTRVIPAAIAATIVYQVAIANGVVTEDTSTLFGSILLALATIFVVEDVASAVFAPKEPAWRIICVESGRATLVRLLLVLVVIVFSANAVLTRLSEWLGSSRELVTTLSALLIVIGAILIFLLARRRLWKLSDNSDSRPIELSSESRTFWRWTRNLAGVISILSVFAVLVGHVALGRFVLTRIYYLSFLFLGIWFARALLREAAQRFGTYVPDSMSNVEQTQITERKESQRLVVFWLQLMIDVVVFAVSVPVSMLIVGVKWTDIRDWVIDIIVGIEIGGVTISLGKIFSAFAAVFIIMMITRFIQRTTDNRIFAPARVESGLRNTFRTLIGYIGLVLGIMVGIGTLGFPLANLAIVAGALSLGIGFGLQSIVNNFVSGLILLFERPIKVGDWIVTAAGEGIVKRISVRSTEIETFDWASVIVPNSALISEPVTNWTHKNRYTRLIIVIGVSYDADPEKVSEILLKVAKANRRTLSYPSPVIYFSGFGDSSLDFEVRIFINNVDDRIPVQNELRFAIFKELKEAGIEIPFPQRDLHVRTLVPGTRMAGEPEPDEGESQGEASVASASSDENT